MLTLQHGTGPFGFLGAAVWWFAGPMPGIDVEPTFHPTNSHAMSVLSRFETQETHARELKQVSSSLSCTTESLRVGICSKRISKRYLRVASGEKPSRAGPSKAWESSQLLAQPWWPIDALTLASNFSNSASVSRFGCSLPPKALCNSMLHWETESTIWKSWWATLPINMQTRLDRPLICAAVMRHERIRNLRCAVTLCLDDLDAPEPPQAHTKLDQLRGRLTALEAQSLPRVWWLYVSALAHLWFFFLVFFLIFLFFFVVLMFVFLSLSLFAFWWTCRDDLSHYYILLPLLLLSFVSTLLLSSHLQSEDSLSIRLLGQPWKAWSRITVLLCPRRPGACRWSNV